MEVEVKDRPKKPLLAMGGVGAGDFLVAFYWLRIATWGGEAQGHKGCQRGGGVVQKEPAVLMEMCLLRKLKIFILIAFRISALKQLTIVIK